MVDGGDVLNKLFGGAARVRAMRLFLLNTEQGFESKDVALRTKSRPEIIRKELNLLSSIGFIKKKPFIKEETIPAKKRGGLPTIRRKKIDGWFLSPSFPYLEQIRNLLTDTDFFDRDMLTARFRQAGKLKLLIISGIFTDEAKSRLDILIVGDKLKRQIVDEAVRTLQAEIGKELSYAVFTKNEFLYRASMYDKLICDIVDFNHETLVDTDKLSTHTLRRI